MAKRKRKEQLSEENLEAADSLHSASPAVSSAPPVEPAETSLPPAPANQNAPEQPATVQPLRTAEKLRVVMARYFPRRKVELIDDYNSGGLGIKLTYDDPAERPSAEITQILKAPEGNYPGLGFKGAIKQWRKVIGSDTEPKRAVAIRMDTERRFEAVGEQMSHEEKLKAEREQNGSKGPEIPS